MEIKIDHKTIRALMDEDQDFKVQVKKAILETAVKHESWRVIDTDTKKIISATIDAISREHYDYINGKVVLASKFRDLIDVKFKEEINKAIYDAYAKSWDDAKARIDEKSDGIMRYADEYIEKVINQGMGKYINAEVERRIHEIALAIHSQTKIELPAETMGE